MTKHTQERKEHALKLMSAPQSKPVSEVARVTGVPEATLYLWRKQARESGRVVPGDGQNPKQWSAADKFSAVLEAASLNEAELAGYCRRKGLLVTQLERWRTEMQAALTRQDSKAESTARAQDKKRIRELEKDLRRKKSPGGNCGVAGSIPKVRGAGYRRRRRLTALPQRLEMTVYILKAQEAGARLALACAELGLSVRTLERWRRDGEIRPDGRPEAERPAPVHKLSEKERQRILQLCHEPRFADLPPAQIVPRLADEGEYVASESSFYRVLREADEQHHRGRSKAPVVSEPVRHVAHGPNQVWSWDVTYLPSRVRGLYFYL